MLVCQSEYSPIYVTSIWLLAQFVSFMKNLTLEFAILMLHVASYKNEERWLIELLRFLLI
jgi:hypothetical protein